MLCLCMFVRTEIILPSGVSQETVEARRVPEDGCALAPCTSSGESCPQTEHEATFAVTDADRQFLNHGHNPALPAPL